MRYDPPSTPSHPRHRQCDRNGCASVLLHPSSLCAQKEPLGIHLPFMEGQNSGSPPGTVAAAAGRSRVQEERLSNCGHLRRVSMAADHHRGDTILPPVAAIRLLLDVSHQNPGTTDLSLYLPREDFSPPRVIHTHPSGIATCAPPAAPGNCPADSWPFPGPAG